MGAEEVFDGDDAGMLVEMGEGPGFFEEAVQAVGELLAGWARIDGQADPIRRPAGAIAGQILLDGQPQMEIVVPGQVGDAEAAMAQHPADAVAPIQQLAQGQGGGQVVVPRLPAAVRAGGDPGCAKAVGAAGGLQGVHALVLGQGG